MPHLILDEWLWADLQNDRSESQRQASAFLIAIQEICDKIVIVKGSKFNQKMFSFWKQANVDQKRRNIARYLRNKFWANSDKSIPLEPHELKPLTQDLAKKINPDDHYIIQAYFALSDGVIVTTDGKLKKLLDEAKIHCQYRDEFVQRYLTNFANRKSH